MCNFGLEITSVSSGTTCPESLAQYDRNIHLIRFQHGKGSFCQMQKQSLRRGSLKQKMIKKKMNCIKKLVNFR